MGPGNAGADKMFAEYDRQGLVAGSIVPEHDVSFWGRLFLRKVPDHMRWFVKCGIGDMYGRLISWSCPECHSHPDCTCLDSILWFWEDGARRIGDTTAGFWR